MELNYDFVREILIECANSTNLSGPTDEEIRAFATSKDVSVNQLAFTVDKLEEADFISGHVQYSGDGPYFISIGNLTWDGNQYLNSIRSDSVWKETKQKVKETGISVTFSILTALATSIAKQKLGLS